MIKGKNTEEIRKQQPAEMMPKWSMWLYRIQPKDGSTPLEPKHMPIYGYMSSILFGDTMVPNIE